MKDEFAAKVTAAVTRRGSKADAEAVLELIRHEYEFRCPSFVYAGPGHQSKHQCTIPRPHGIDGEHGDLMYEWEGTAIKDAEGKLTFNPRHYGGGCC